VVPEFLSRNLTEFRKLLIAMRKVGFSTGVEMEVGKEMATTTPSGVNYKLAPYERNMIIQPRLVSIDNLSNGIATRASPMR
jgi:hypothetical protein